MMNIFKKLFLILKSTNSKINDFENFIEKWEKDSKKDSENKMIEVEKKYKEIFTNYKNKNDYEIEIVNVFCARSQKIGSYNLMKAQNPVYVISAYRKGE